MLLISLLARGAGLVDNPIVADVVKYIDSTNVEAKWVVSAYEQPPPPPPPPPPSPSSDCTFEKGLDWAGAHNTSSGTQVPDVSSKEQCCGICAADHSCFVAVWTEKDVSKVIAFIFYCSPCLLFLFRRTHVSN